MSSNNAFSDKDAKLKHYAAMAAHIDRKLDQMIGRGAFTIHTLGQLAADPLASVGGAAGNETSPAPQGAGRHVSTAGKPALSTALHNARADEAPAAAGLHTVAVIRMLSLVCDMLLPFHSMVPLAQQIKRSAVIWYISGNQPEGIQIHTATFRQLIDIRYNRDRQHCYSRNRVASLPPPRGIALHLRTIFRILKLQPFEGDDGDD